MNETKQSTESERYEIAQMRIPQLALIFIHHLFHDIFQFFESERSDNYIVLRI